jgi:DNA-binding protein YbaB
MEETAVVGSAETLKRTITEAENSASRKAFEDKRNRMAEKLTEAVQTQCMKVSKQHAVHMFFTNRYIWYH